MWTGNFKGAKGYKVYKLSTSNTMAGIMPAARYSKDEVFMFVYRTNRKEVDKDLLKQGLREILRWDSKCLLVTDTKAGAVTIEFYCRLKDMPTEEKMAILEGFLVSGEF